MQQVGLMSRNQIPAAPLTIVDWSESFPLPTPEPGEPVPLLHYITGDCFFEYRSEQIRRRILVPLRYEETVAQNRVASAPVRLCAVCRRVRGQIRLVTVVRLCRLCSKNLITAFTANDSRISAPALKRQTS